MPLKIWVGAIGNEAQHFFDAERKGDTAEKVRQATGPYKWSVTDAGDYVTTEQPVPSEYT